MSLGHRRRVFIPLNLGLWLTLFQFAFARTPPEPHLITPVYRILQQLPEEGIQLVSTQTLVVDSFLLNGTSEDLLFQYVFLPPDGFSPSQYRISFQCDASAVWDADTCSITNAQANVLQSTRIAYNTTVACSFARLPGSTDCQLVATLMQNTTDVLQRARVRARFVSPTITNNVYGVAFYLPDSNGQLSETSQILSGELAAFSLPAYDRVVQGVREISTTAFVPGLQRRTGPAFLDVFANAQVTLDIGDYIFRYDPAVCQLAGAVFADGRVSLPDAATCGVGMAMQSDATFPKLGVQFRSFKSGTITFRLAWNSFGDSDEPYEQVISFEILEPAPPVLTAVSKLDFYRSTPCDVELLGVEAYNVRFADERQVIVDSADGANNTVWSQVPGDAVYDPVRDMSRLSFESGGGSGQGVNFRLQAIFAGETRQAVAPPDLDTTVDFSVPLLLTGLSENVIQVEGGEVVQVNGNLQEFQAEDTLYIGGYQILGSDLISISDEQLVFQTPPLSSLGNAYVYPLTVGVCAERSNSLTLQYQVAPIVKISSSDSSTDDRGTYLINAVGVASFVAEVSGHNFDATYVWKLFNSLNEQVTTGDILTNAQIFVVPSDLLQPNEVYTVRVLVTNSLDLTATAEEAVTQPPTQEEFVLINVHEVETLRRSVGSATLIQAHVAMSVVEEPELLLEWTYRDEVYPAIFDPNTTEDISLVTGPKRLGFEFFVAQEDLVVGRTEVSLSAQLVANPQIRGSDRVTLVVVPSALQAKINNGINGTLVLTTNDLKLSGSRSHDPDILPGEGDATAGLQYEWTSCRKCAVSSFRSEASDCATLLPSLEGRNNVNFTVQSSVLRSSLLERGSATYFSFGLRVSKGDRSAEAFLFFELREGTDTVQRIPQLSRLAAVDSKGVVLDMEAVSIFGDIIVQPRSEDPIVTWSFDMGLRNQRYLFSQFGALKNGTGYIAKRGVQTRLALGFNPGVLLPDTDYHIDVTAAANDTELQSMYELSFRTAEVPSLSCTGPEEGSGFVGETRFTVSGALSFETQRIEYCFYLASGEDQYVLGDGCSAVPFASFSFYKAGTFSVECVARTVAGHTVGRVVLPDAITLAEALPVREDVDEISLLSDRLAHLTSQMRMCETLRDDGCIVSLISVAKDFALEVDQAVATAEGSEASQELVQKTRDYVAELARLSASLADRTVFRPNQVAAAVDLSYYLAQVPAGFVSEEETLFRSLRQVEVAVEATEGAELEPIASEMLVSRVSEIANRSIATAYALSSSGTTRRLGASRSLDITTRAALISVLLRVPNLVAQARSQQAGCGFRGSERTTGGPTGLPEVPVSVAVGCSGESMSVSTGRTGVTVCGGRRGRQAVSVAAVDAGLLIESGLLPIAVTVREAALVDADEVWTNGCVQVRMENVALSTGVVAGTLEQGGTEAGCEGCVKLKQDEADRIAVDAETVTVTTGRVGMFVAGVEVRAISGRGLTALVVGGVVAMVVMVAVILVVGTVGKALAGDGAAAEEAEVLDWEYFERDMFGRNDFESMPDARQVIH